MEINAHLLQRPPTSDESKWSSTVPRRTGRRPRRRTLRCPSRADRFDDVEPTSQSFSQVT